MSQTAYVLFDRTRIIKDPIWVAVERFLNNRLYELNSDPTKREEYELSLKRYHGLTVDDVSIEPINDVSPTKRLISMVTRRGGFARVDMEINLITFTDVIEEFKLNCTNLHGFTQIIDNFRTTTDNKIVYDYTTGDHYIFAKGEDLANEIKPLLNGIYFDKIEIDDIPLEEGQIPDNFATQTLTIKDPSLINGVCVIPVINHKLADGWVNQRVLGLRPVITPAVINLLEGKDNEGAGGKISFHLDGYDPKVHGKPSIFYGNLHNDTKIVQEFFWPTDFTWKDGIVEMTFKAFFKTKVQDPSFSATFRVQADMLDGSGKAQSNVGEVTFKPEIWASRYIIKDNTPKEGVGYAQGVGFEGKLFDNGYQKEGAEDQIFTTVTGWFKTVTTEDNKLYFIAAETMVAGNSYHVVYSNGPRVFETDVTVDIADRLMVTQDPSVYQKGYVKTNYDFHFKLAGRTELTAHDVVLGQGLYPNHTVDKLEDGRYQLTVQPIPISPSETKAVAWDITGTSDDSYGNYNTTINTPFLLSGKDTSMDWDSGGDNQIDWDKEEIVITGKPVDGNGNTLPGPFEWLPPIHGGVGLDPDRDIVVENKPDGSFEIKIPIKVDPETGGNASGSIVVVGPDDKVVEIPFDENVLPKPTFVVVSSDLVWNQNVVNPQMELKYTISWPSGTTPKPASLVTPFEIATHTKDGVLTPVSQSFDEKTLVGKAVFDIALDLYHDTIYTFKTKIKAGSALVPITWTKTMVATQGYYLEPKSVNLIGGYIVNQYTVWGPDQSHPAAVSIQSARLTMKDGQPAVVTPNIVYDAQTGLLTAKVKVTRLAANTFDAMLDMVVKINSNSIMLPITQHVIGNSIKVTIKSTTQGTNCLISKVTAIDEITTLPMTGPLVISQVSNNYPLGDAPPTVVEDTPGNYTITTPVVTPSDVYYSYSIEQDLVWQVNSIGVSGNMKFDFTMAMDWPSGNATCTPEPITFTLTGDPNVGNYVVLEAHCAVTIRLADGSIPKGIIKFQRPLNPASHPYGIPNPTYENYDPKTGRLEYGVKTYGDPFGDRSYTFGGNIEFFGYTGGKHPTYTYCSGSIKTWPTVVATQKSVSTNAERNKMTVNYQLTSSDNKLPLEAAIKVPFTAATNTVAGTKSPSAQSYDKATGLGSFTFDIAPGEDVTQCSFTTDFNAQWHQPLVGKTFTGTVPASTLFKAVYVKSAMMPNMAMVRFNIANLAGTKPTTATMGDLKVAIGTTGGTKTPAAVQYDKATGNFEFAMPVVAPTDTASAAYQFDGEITVNGTQVIPFSVKLTNYNYVLTNTVNALGSGNMLNVGLKVVKKPGDIPVTLARIEVRNCPKQLPGQKETFAINGAKTEWTCSIPVSAPSTTAKEDYLASGVFVAITPEGLETELPWNMTFTNYLANGSQISNTYQDMTFNGDDITVSVKNQISSGGFPVNAVLQTPLTTALAPTNSFGKMPKSQQYDKTTGILNFVFTGKGPVGGETYNFNGNISYPDYGSDVTTNMVATKVIPNPAFTIRDQKSAIRGAVLYTEFMIKNGANAIPSIVTMGDLLSATGTVGGTRTPKNQGYNPTTGKFWFEMDIVTSNQDGGVNYNFDGVLTAEDKDPMPFQVRIPSVKINVSVTGSSLDANTNWRTIMTITRADGSLIKTGTFKAGSIPNLRPGESISQDQDTAKTAWYLYIPVTAPATDKKTVYTGTVYFEYTTPEGVTTQTPIDLSFTKFLDGAGSYVNTYLDSMTIMGAELTALVKCEFGGTAGVTPVKGVFVTPFSLALETAGGSLTPKSQSYDDATGKGKFVFDVNPPAAGTGSRYAFNTRINFPEYGDSITKPMLSAAISVSKTILPSDVVGPFTATHVESVLKDNVLTVTHKVANNKNTFPAKANLPALTTATNTVGNSLAIKSQSYDPATGLHVFSVDVNAVGNRTSRVYTISGKIVADDTQNVSFTYSVTGHSYTLTQGQVAWVGNNLQVKHVLIRTSDDTAVNGAKLVVTAMPKLLPGATPFAQHYNNETNYTVPYPVTLPTAANTQYTGNGYLIVPQVDGNLKHYVPWTIDYTSGVIPAPGVNKVELQDIDYTSSAVTFSVLCKQADGSIPATAKFVTPLYRTFTPARVDGNTPTSTSYDAATGILKATFTGKAPIATPADYQIQGDVVFGTATPEVTIPLLGVWPLDLNSVPNGVRP